VGFCGASHSRHDLLAVHISWCHVCADLDLVSSPRRVLASALYWVCWTDSFPGCVQHCSFSFKQLSAVLRYTPPVPSPFRHINLHDLTAGTTSELSSHRPLGVIRAYLGVGLYGLFLRECWRVFLCLQCGKCFYPSLLLLLFVYQLFNSRQLCPRSFCLTAHAHLHLTIGSTYLSLCTLKWRWSKWMLGWIRSRLLFPASNGKCFFTSLGPSLSVCKSTWSLTVCNSTESAPPFNIVSPTKRDERPVASTNIITVYTCLFRCVNLTLI